MLLAVGAVLALLLGTVTRDIVLGDDNPFVPGAALGSSMADLVGEPRPRTPLVYGGLGAWVDVFDYVPAYSNDEPALAIDDLGDILDDMVGAGVETLYLQAARSDERAKGLVVDAPLVAEWLIEAHRRDIRVVAWYLPDLTDVEDDLARLDALRTFEILGHTFDGIAVDIEARTVEEPAERSRRLVELSTRYRATADGEAIGAIVLPPVLLEVVNEDFWPDFPWRDLAPLYDVWLPMAYWSQRTADSGYLDGFTYFEESTRRMRANLGLPAAPVHGIGGIGDDLSAASIDRFGLALETTDAVGGSIYDWATLPPEQRTAVRDAVEG